MIRGNVIRVNRYREIGKLLYSPYDHYGIYAGNDQVIHYLSDKGIIKTSLKKFSSESRYIEVMEFRPSYVNYSLERCYKLANSRVGEDEYNLIFNNCEHFALWARLGIKVSTQKFPLVPISRIRDVITKIYGMDVSYRKRI